MNLSLRTSAAVAAPVALASASLLAVLVLTSGCAVMSTSVMETAETVEPGHLKLGADYNVGIELTSLIFLEDDESGTFIATEMAGGEAWGFKIGVGLNTDLNAKLWASVGGMGGRLYAKHALAASDPHLSMAVAPGITFVTTDSDDDGGSLDEYIAEVHSFGGELPFIVTYRFNDVVAVTGIVRYSLDSIGIAFPEGTFDELNDTWLLHRFGIINGWSLDLGAFYLRPEIGVEMATRINGSFGYVPIVGLGAGFEF
jgi:hypothetical protein